MSQQWRWDPCVNHQGAECEAFISSFFSAPTRRLFVIAGAGFDPRSIIGCMLLTKVVQGGFDGVLIREERPNPSTSLMAQANSNHNDLKTANPKFSDLRFDVFAKDGAVIGGRGIVNGIQAYPLEKYTDVIIDLSALSVGVGFPVVRYVFERFRSQRCATNLHLFVADDPGIDSGISSIPSDRVGSVLGFQGKLGLDETANQVRLWLPQLVRGKREILERLRSFVDPDDVCPILPFPAVHPRLADELVEQYRPEFESTWEVDARNLVYADQRNPLDLYRTVLRMDDARQRIFSEVGGSMLILSPLGSKALAIGALMASIEKDFPVTYVEALGYAVDMTLLQAAVAQKTTTLLHIWLYGEAYARQD